MLNQIYKAIVNAEHYNPERREFFYKIGNYGLGALGLLMLPRLGLVGEAEGFEYYQDPEFVKKNWQLVIPQIKELLNYLTQKEREYYLKFVEVMQRKYENEIIKCQKLKDIEDKAYCVVRVHNELESGGYYIPEIILAYNVDEKDPSVLKIRERWEDVVRNIAFVKNTNNEIINFFLEGNIKQVINKYDKPLFRAYKKYELYPVGYKEIKLLTYRKNKSSKIHGYYIHTITLLYFNENAPLFSLNKKINTVAPVIKLESINRIKKIVPNTNKIEIMPDTLQIKYTEALLTFNKNEKFKKTDKPHLNKYKIKQPKTMTVAIPYLL